MKHIRFERSGGLMGRKVSLDLDLEQLPPEEVEGLLKLVAEADFFTLQPDPAQQPLPDAFSYTITIKMEEQQHTVHFAEPSSLPALQPLLDELSARARPKPRPLLPSIKD